MTELFQEESEEARRLRESRIAALRRSRQDDLADRFLDACDRFREYVGELPVRPDSPLLTEAPVGLDALLEDAVLCAYDPSQAGEDIDDDQFYEEIHAELDTWLDRWGQKRQRLSRSISHESEQQDIAAAEVRASRTHRSPAFDVVWMGVTLLLMIVIIQVLVEAVNPLAAAVGTLCAGTLISIKLHQAVARRRLRAIRQDVLKEAEALERTAARYAVEARVLELEGAGTSVESRRLKRRAARLDAGASVLQVAAAWMRD